MNQKKNIAAITSAILLFLSLLDGWSYDYFTLMRWFVCVASFYIAYVVSEDRRSKLAWVFGIIGILFNPLFIVHLSRNTWEPIDFVIGVFFVSSVFFIKISKNHEII